MRIVIRLYEDNIKKPHIDEFKDDAYSEIQLEDTKEAISEFLDEGLQKWQEIADEGQDDAGD